ncbi:low temperature requirement protein A [Aldersonia sp. NBC_00410]|uniref:low temperature requirement protein A n=1 Tax=Aldersonia sp. NBC_00410 TaxID=2975954 RepID=UPI00225AD960|nr:low temperature requirement protein A [Aldersonia sp. NBC_00410]MCX5043121.1 low temperature requirement protein A [Aldersonia sp. NBC_00410]
MSTTRRARLQALPERASVSQLELYFDLVFVFALTQVTDLLVQTTALNVLRAVLVLGVMWWAWVGYSWLGNVVRADEGVMRVVMFTATAVTFILALTIPEAFEDLPGELSGPVVFAVGYFVGRSIHLGTFVVISRGDPQLRRQLVRWVPSVLLGTVFLLIASQTEGWTQIAFWIAALVGDYVGTLLAGLDWRLRSPSHFAERHGLIIIVAIGESIVSIGIGVTHLPISWPIITASLLGLTVSALLWWSYFDTAALAVEHALSDADERRQIQIAQRCYTFAHLPMVIGIVMVSLGLKKVLNYAGDETHHTLSDALYGVPLFCLYGGAAVFVLALVYSKWFATHELGIVRLVLAALIIALIPLAAALPAIASLALLVAVLVTLIGYETWRYYESRDEIRHGEHDPAHD